MLRAMRAVFERDLRLSARSFGTSAMTVLFFLLALSLFPLGVGASPDLLARIGPGIIWVLALLSVLLSLERLFQTDFDDGSLELMAQAPVPLELLILAKAFAHWLVSGLLLVLISPLLAIMMAMPSETLWIVPASLLLGTPSLVLIGAIGAALLVGARAGGAFLALLVTPLMIPVLIFGVGAIDAGVMGLGSSVYWLILGAILLAAAAATPFAVAAALRLALE